LEKEMNTLPSRHKQCHFNLTTSPLYLVKLKIAQNSLPLTAVRSVEPMLQTFAESRSVFGSFLSLFVKNFFNSLLAENILYSHGFYQKFVFKLNMTQYDVIKQLSN